MRIWIKTRKDILKSLSSFKGRRGSKHVVLSPSGSKHVGSLDDANIIKGCLIFPFYSIYLKKMLENAHHDILEGQTSSQQLKKQLKRL